MAYFSVALSSPPAASPPAGGTVTKMAAFAAASGDDELESVFVDYSGPDIADGLAWFDEAASAWETVEPDPTVSQLPRDEDLPGTAVTINANSSPNLSQLANGVDFAVLTAVPLGAANTVCDGVYSGSGNGEVTVRKGANCRLLPARASAATSPSAVAPR